MSKQGVDAAILDDLVSLGLEGVTFGISVEPIPNVLVDRVILGLNDVKFGISDLGLAAARCGMSTFVNEVVLADFVSLGFDEDVFNVSMLLCDTSYLFLAIFFPFRLTCLSWILVDLLLL